MKDSYAQEILGHVDSAREISTRTIGEAWLDVAEKIVKDGQVGTYDGLAIRELILTTHRVSNPRNQDKLIDQLADPMRLQWMRANFTQPAQVRELGGADSYATRLYNYDHQGIDQIAWVIERLRDDASSRSATITTFQPLTDTTYIPCVSLLDFYVQNDRLNLVVYAHSIDFGTKGFENLVELAYVQEQVAESLAIEIGHLTLIVKSAHIYEADVEGMKGVLLSQCDVR